MKFRRSAGRPPGDAGAYWGSAGEGLKVADLWSGPLLPDRFGADVAERLVVPVDAVPDENADLWFVDPLVLADHGFEVGKYGLLTEAQEAALREHTILRPTKRDEAPVRQVMATRYADQADTVRGDGRAGVLGRPLLARSKKTRTSGLLRVKGIATSVSPVGQTVEDAHGHGRMDVAQAVHDAVHQLTDHLNGIESPRAVAVAGTKERFQFRGTGRRDRWYTRTAGYLVECGRFDRAAHLLELLRSDSPAYVPTEWSKGAVRRFLDDVNEQVRLQLSRPTPLSMQGLFAHLNKVKAIEVADRYWMRTPQGSPTYDNIAFLQSIDHGTVHATDRTHPSHGNLQEVGGFAREPGHIFSQVVDTYFSFFALAATRSERRNLAKWSDPTLRRKAIEGPFERRMAENALLHLGLTASQVDEVMRTRGDAAVAFGKLAREIGETPESGAVHSMDRVKVQDPARYDLFAGLAALVRVRGEGDAAAQLARAMKPIVPAPKRDEAAARRLLDAAAPLLEVALGEASDLERAAVVDLAERINRPCPHLIATALSRWREPLIDDVQKGRVSPTRFRAELQAYARQGLRRGPSSASAVVARLGRGDVAADPNGVATLHAIEERGVRIEEISNGTQHGWRFRVGGDHLGTDDIARYRARVDTGHGRRELTPTRLEDGEPVFEFFPDRPSTKVDVTFFDAEAPKEVWDLDGRGFGGGYEPLAASLAVRLALARWAGTDLEHVATSPGAGGPTPLARGKAVHNAMRKHHVPPDRVLEHAIDLAGWRRTAGSARLESKREGFVITRKSANASVRLEFDWSGGDCEVSLTQNRSRGPALRARLNSLDFPTGAALRRQ